MLQPRKIRLPQKFKSVFNCMETISEKANHSMITMIKRLCKAKDVNPESLSYTQFHRSIILKTHPVTIISNIFIKI